MVFRRPHDAIANSAKVNKALLYYYFKGKQGLYAAAVERSLREVVKNALAALNPAYSAGERLLRSAVNHFDRILTQRGIPNLMQQEMVRFRHGNAGSLPLSSGRHSSHSLKNCSRP